MGRYTSFVILGAMRTGSNFLEASLNEVEGLTSYGEAFNPHFIGRKDQTEMLGVTLKAREADPSVLLDRMRAAAGGLPGFRLFQGHDPRVLDLVLADPRCAKIVLSRDPIDSFVSLKIAGVTGQWMLRSERNRRSARIRFDPEEYARYLEERDAFYAGIRRRLQISGQTAFEIAYPELGDVAVLNGLAAWLGAPGRLDRPSRAILRQNPVDIAERVENPGDIPAAAAARPIARTAEPARNAAVPTWIAAARARLLYLPVKGGPTDLVMRWMAALDGVEPTDLRRDFTRGTLRAWREEHPGWRAFTVVRHPALRAHAAFAECILGTGPGTYAAIRARLRSDFAVPLPEGEPGEEFGPEAHRAAFLGYLAFVKANLAGQTSVRVDGAWASQESVLRGFCEVQAPDMVLREEELAEGLPQLAARVGARAPAVPDDTAARLALDAIHDRAVERAVRAAYARDYAAYGYGDWGVPRRP